MSYRTNVSANLLGMGSYYEFSAGQTYAGLGSFVEDSTVACGTTKEDRKVTQTALNALGYKGLKNGVPTELVVDGIVGEQTKIAMGNYAAAKLFQGVLEARMPDKLCGLLMKDYAALQESKAKGGDCPAGMVRFQGTCVPNLFPQTAQGQAASTGETTPATGTVPACKAGEIGFPPFCFPVPSSVGAGAATTIPSTAGGGGQAIYLSPAKAGMSTTTKLALGVGGVVAIGAVLFAFASKKKSASTMAF